MSEGKISMYQPISFKEVQGKFDIPLCILQYDPIELEKNYGIQFEDAHDDLEGLKVGYLQTRIGNQFSLVRYENSLSPGTIVYAKLYEDQFERQLEDLLNAMQLERKDLIWVRDFSEGENLNDPR